MKILKKLSIGFLALIICVCSCFKFVNAEFIDEPVYLDINNSYSLAVSNDVLLNEGRTIAYTGDDSIYLYYSYNDNSPIILYEKSSVSGSETINIPLLYLYEKDNFTYYKFVYNSSLESNEFYYDDIEYLYFDTDTGITSFSVYDTIYDLVETYIFGGDIEIGSHQDLTATTLSSIICVLVFALPFLVIWKVIKVIMG